MRPTLRTTVLHLLLLSAPTASAIDENELAVVFNRLDPVSVELAGYYAERRSIPQQHLIGVALHTDQPQMRVKSFKQLYAAVRDHTPEAIQAYLLMWTAPYRVGCMSITSAFAFGYDERYCARRCAPTAASPYYNSPSRRPYDDYDIRPTMLLASRTPRNAKILIDRGARADYSNPLARGYLTITSDARRNVRSELFQQARRYIGERFPLEIVEAEGIRDRFDVMFYFTGMRRVPFLDTLGFLPGALADHLTSAGGALMQDKQMNVLEWLEAGATASYGTVVEPCNFPQKFPNPTLTMMYYLNGETSIETYWKSVAWPGQGVFVGEPLAKPFAHKAAPKPPS